MTNRMDRIADLLGTTPALLGSAILALAPLALLFFAPSLGVPPWLGLPFAAAFGVGGAERDLGPRKQPPPRPDYTKIAVLEYELLGIEPKPGTVAAFAVGMQRVGRALNGEQVGVKEEP